MAIKAPNQDKFDKDKFQTIESGDFGDDQNKFFYDTEKDQLFFIGPKTGTVRQASPGDYSPAQLEIAKAQFTLPAADEKKPTDAVADAAKAKEALGSEFQSMDTQRKMQRQDLTKSIGPAALIGGLGAAVQLGQAFAPGRLGNVQDRYADEELKRLQRKQRRGQLGLTAGERGEMERQMLNPVRQFARESQRQAEEERASTGRVTSAAGQVRAERERQRIIADQARQAGAQIAQADMQRADQELQKMEDILSFKASRQAQALANLQKTGMDIAYLAGLTRAGKGMKQIDPANLIDAGIDPSKAPELARRLSTKAGGIGGLRAAEVGRELERAGFDPNSAAYRNVMGTYKMQTQPPTERTFGEGRTSLQEKRIQQATGPDIVEPQEGQVQVTEQFAAELPSPPPVEATTPTADGATFMDLRQRRDGNITYNYRNVGTVENPVFEFRSSTGTVIKEGDSRFSAGMREEAMEDLAIATSPAATFREQALMNSVTQVALRNRTSDQTLQEALGQELLRRQQANQITQDEYNRLIELFS